VNGSEGGTVQTVYNYTLTYQPNSNVAGDYNDSVMGTWTYSYDSLNRLPAAQGRSAGEFIHKLPLELRCVREPHEPGDGDLGIPVRLRRRVAVPASESAAHHLQCE